VLPSESSLTSKQVGQIFYDISAGGYKGVNKDGKIDILTNDGSTIVQKPDPRTVLSTEPTGRILASALITLDVNGEYQLSAQDGNWISKVETREPGVAKVTLTTGAFSKDPICTCTPNTGGNVICKFEELPTKTQIVAAHLNAGSPANMAFSLICVGAK
jgi:hypothetical protein